MFLKEYNELDNPSKHLALITTLTTLSDIQYGKMMYLEELRPDLVALKQANVERRALNVSTGIIENNLLKALNFWN